MRDLSIHAATRKLEGPTKTRRKADTLDLKFVQPLLERHVLFSAVARATCRYDIARSCASSARHWIHVIDRVARAAAIYACRTAALDHGLDTFRGNSLNASSSQRCSVLSLISKTWIRCIPVNHGFIAMLAAFSISDRWSSEPCLAARAPLETKDYHPTNIRPAWSPVRTSRLPTVAADGVDSTLSALITSERWNLFPGPAAMTPPTAEQNIGGVLTSGNSNPLSRRFHRAVRGASHGPNIRGIQ